MKWDKNKIETDYKDGDFFFMHRHYPLDAVRTIKDLCTKRLPDAYGFDPATQIQVLCPSKKGDTGTVNLNQVLQETLNPSEKGKAEYNTGYRIFREGDKVMQTKNNYNIHWESPNDEGDGIFNGDIGFIEIIDIAHDAVVIDFSGKRATYTKEQLTEIELAYAVTVHKSQGSEFDAVVIPMISVNNKLCYRNLLYTAVTRAKKMLIIIGQEEEIQKMVDNNRSARRYTCLKKMLKNDFPEKSGGVFSDNMLLEE